MKRGSKPTFSNIPLKRWLLKVGPVRRRVLLTKFRADLVRLGPSKLAWREGLLQLSSRPFVRLIRVQRREATAQMDQDSNIQDPRLRCKENRVEDPRLRYRENHIEDPRLRSKEYHIQDPRLRPKENHIDDPRLRCKEARTLYDNNNNRNDLAKQESSHVSSSSGHRKHRKTERRDTAEGGSSEDAECSTSGVAADNLGKSVNRENSERTHSSESQKRSRSRERSKKKRKRWVTKEGENPNGITWRLIPIDMDPLPGKKERLRAKFVELFGENGDVSDVDESLQDTETRDTSRAPVPKETAASGKRMETQKPIDPLNRKSPIFSHRGKKKRRKSHAAESGKKLKTADDNERRDSVASDNNSIGMGCGSLLYQEEIHTPHHKDTLITNSAASVVPVVGDRVAVNSHKVSTLEPDTASPSRDSSTADDVDTCKRGDSRLGNNRTGGDTLDSGFTPENDIHSDTTDTSLETLPVTRHQSVIVKIDKDCAGPVQTSSNPSGPKAQLASVINRLRADLTPRVKIDSTSTSEPAADATSLRIKNLPESQASLPNKSLKNEVAGQFIPPGPPPKAFEWIHPTSVDKKPLEISSTRCSPDPLDNDPKPSSTTDMESSARLSCDSERLLGALDNIYLALHCRRRICEREQAASKLAIMRNRQEEVLRAKQEYESKLKIFREDFGYLYDRLETWDRVLRFIAQGLDHRTPPGTTSFTAAEVELVMQEAEVKVQAPISKREASAEPPKLQSVGKVLCTIDLTVDSIEDARRDPCDSSTDPPRSQNHLKLNPKTEPKDAVDGSCPHDFNANEIQLDLPSIGEVKTISSQQFETIGEKIDSSITGDDDPCLLCSRASLVACGRCTKATYCSKLCQEMHWIQSHHVTCVPLIGIVSCKK